MKKGSPFLAILLLTALACSDPVVPKPDKLVSRDDMIEMLTDIHLAEAVFQAKRYTTEELSRYTESDFYYSVLKKHDVADSTFEQSLIYYSRKPKEFEKIYTRVVNRLTQMQQKLEEKEQSPVDIGNKTVE